MSTAIAQPNIALVKYWGKTREDLIVPATGSISLTLDVFPTTTTVELAETQERDTAKLDGAKLSGTELERIVTLLDVVRRLAASTKKAIVTSTNTVPTAAGLASSSAAFAALTVAAVNAYGVNASPRLLSRIARRGSGSACRSIFDGLARWNAGVDDETSYAEPLEWSGEELAMILAVVSTAKKPVSSRVGMTQTIDTSPFFEGWVRSNQQLVDEGTSAVHQGDFTRLGEITELSTMRMHATMFGANPPLRYLNAHSIALFDSVIALREAGLEAYATADAGPNVKVLCKASEASQISARLESAHNGVDFVVARAGLGARIASGSSS